MTSEQYDALTPRQQRNKVANHCGWSCATGRVVKKRLGIQRMFADEAYYWSPNGKTQWQDNPPDFLHDLNAMENALFVMTVTQEGKYADILVNVFGGRRIHRATASQQAKAFVLTMEAEETE